jgi:hypothetical protein
MKTASGLTKESPRETLSREPAKSRVLDNPFDTDASHLKGPAPQYLTIGVQGEMDTRHDWGMSPWPGSPKRAALDSSGSFPPPLSSASRDEVKGGDRQKKIKEFKCNLIPASEGLSQSLSPPLRPSATTRQSTGHHGEDNGTEAGKGKLGQKEGIKFDGSNRPAANGDSCQKEDAPNKHLEEIKALHQSVSEQCDAIERQGASGPAAEISTPALSAGHIHKSHTSRYTADPAHDTPPIDKHSHGQMIDGHDTVRQEGLQELRLPEIPSVPPLNMAFTRENHSSGTGEAHDPSGQGVWVSKGDSRQGVQVGALQTGFTKASRGLIPSSAQPNLRTTPHGHVVRGRTMNSGVSEEETTMPARQVKTGPWGGRRWVPKSSRYPRFAKPLRWFQVRRESHADISITGSGAQQAMQFIGASPPKRLDIPVSLAPRAHHDLDERHAKGYVSPSPLNVLAGNSSAKSQIPLASVTVPAIISLGSVHSVPSGQQVVPDSLDRRSTGREETDPFSGDWMSAMWLGSLDMHQRLYNAVEVKKGAGGRGTGWLTPHDSAQWRSRTTGDGIRGVKRDPQTDAPTASNTFLTDLVEDLDVGFGRGAAGPQTARESDSRVGTSDWQKEGPGIQTARVRGTKSVRMRTQYNDNKKRAQNAFLAINAGKNVGDLLNPRALNSGWAAQDFRASFADIREENHRRRLKFRQRASSERLDPVQLASLCLSFHMTNTLRSLTYAVRRAVNIAVGESECILIRRCGQDSVCSFDDDESSNATSSPKQTMVELGVGVVGSALLSTFAMTWNLLDENLMLDIADQSVGLQDIGMVYTMPLRKPPDTENRVQTGDDWSHQAPFGLFVVQRMFGSFDKDELETMNVIAEHAAIAFHRLGNAGSHQVWDSPKMNFSSKLGYPIIENMLSLHRAPAYDFMTSDTMSRSSSMGSKI